jgi:hypothetical protein
MPQTWRGTYHGNREYLTAMQRTWEKRQRLEADHPELVGDTRPVAAHEGRYEQVPLRVGEPVITAPAETPGHGHGHSHGGGSEKTT